MTFASAEPNFGQPLAGPFSPDKNILSDSEVREELRLLVDDGDPAPVGGGRPRMTIKKKLAVVGAFFSRDNADEGAFSGPVRSGDT